MTNKVIVGLQLGDESKSRVVDYLAKSNTYIVRFNGSSNAGHTTWVDGKKFVFHLLPSGILHKHTINVIATGVLLDPIALADEINEMRGAGITITPETLKISARCSVVTELHRAMDAWEEDKRGTNKIGTTKRGVGPAAVEKAARQNMRIIDVVRGDTTKFIDKKTFIEQATKYNFSALYPDFIEKIEKAAQELKPFLCDTSLFIYNAVQKGNVIFEGAQATLLDIDHGAAFPFITSSNCLSSYAATSSGIGAHYLNEVIGVMKPYITYIGSKNRPFPTIMDDRDDNRITELGAEFGATTGRKRNCGWLDLVQLRYAARLNGLTSIAISKLDVLSGFGDVKVCTNYTIDGHLFNEMPMDPKDLFKAIPNYKVLPGWKGDISSIRRFAELPNELKQFIEFIEEGVNVRIKYISVGKDREQMIERVS